MTTEAAVVTTETIPTITTEPTAGAEQLKAAVLPEGANPTPETPPEAPKEEPKADGKKFAALTRREREVNKKERELAERVERAERVEGLLKSAKENPKQFFEETGLTLEELIKGVLKDGEEPKEDDKLTSLEKKVDSILEQTQKREQEEIDRISAGIEQALNGYQAEINTMVDANPDKFELVRALNQQDLAMEVMKRHFNETGEVPEPDVVLETVEEYLTENTKKIMGLKKFASASASEGAERTKQNSDARETTGPSPTLTNNMTAQAPRTGEEHLSDEERLQRAAKLLVFNAG